jgi:hypothetical protein
MATFEFDGLGRLMGRLNALRNLDPTPLLSKWEVIIEEDNRKGVLAGTDKDGKPMIPVEYRPIKSSQEKWTARRERLHTAVVTGPAGDNLTSAQYRRLTGPPLAPRGASSRVVKNLQTGHGYDTSKGEYYAEGAWPDVRSKKGREFLEAHFDGTNGLPKRDLRGVRPWGKQQALEALYDWMKDVLRPFA